MPSLHRNPGRRSALLAVFLLGGGACTAAQASAHKHHAAPAAANIAPLPGTRMATLATPVEDQPVTSPYGWRIHPILKKRRFHKGVDYGAPEGTPVYAAEDGVIEAIGRRGHYGLYLRIRHCAAVQTAYAHLAAFAPGLATGSTVKRGEVIGSVGRTGWATGPHLYYEVIVQGHRVNPNRPGLQVPVDLAAPEPQPATTPQATASGMP
jgi:murein DD-endopeptidase MepM/ murein hydrolase activator NlpD